MANTNSAVLELSVVPPIHLEKRIEYLIQYPHGCLEQTVSSAFPQLYLSNFTKLTASELSSIETNVNKAISKLSTMQSGSGAFGFWSSGTAHINDWANVYAGHFLVEAQKQGYSSAGVLLNSWKSGQRRLANSWRSRDRNSNITQAYRLYTLALAQNASLPAMNRFRESVKSDPISQWLLATAYYHAGESDAARKISAEAVVTAPSYSAPGITFGSTTRDNALMLLCMAEMKNSSHAKRIADIIASELSSNKWLSTQTTSFALLSLSKLYGTNRGSTSFSYTATINGKKEKQNSNFPIVTMPVDNIPASGMPIEIENSNSSQQIFVTVNSVGSPPPGEETIINTGMELAVSYNGSRSGVTDISRIGQGEDVTITIAIQNTTTQVLENLALTHIIPSGWTIHNTRFESGATATDVTYQDYRYDRVLTYFTLKPNETKTITTMINASFAGRYYLPSISVKDMYIPNIQAATEGQWVEVVKEK
jgi:uncharacterized protein YfaS (alpha-2-macroglobulin family)